MICTPMNDGKQRLEVTMMATTTTRVMVMMLLLLLLLLLEVLSKQRLLTTTEASGHNVGASRIRIGFWGILCSNYNTEPPK